MSIPTCDRRASSQILTRIDSRIMDEDPACYPALSLHLSRTLDEIGLNSLTVKRRRTTFLICEQMLTWKYRLNGIGLTVYHFGSQTEGTTTAGLNSDVDQLMCFDYYNVIQDQAKWELGKRNLLMLQEDTVPGYCRLQELRLDTPMASQDVDDIYLTYDDRGRVIVKNTVMHLTEENQGEGRDMNGPAMSKSGIQGKKDRDYVGAYRCNSWPTQAEEFTRRLRHHGWPSQHLLQEAVQHGFFLVAVGHKLSPTKQLEWRISVSMAERCLMFSLSIVHIKCYVVMKMLMKQFVEPLVKKSLSSYHCKTALLYCTENTEARFWRDDNLIQCVIKCLEMLCAWVTDGFCPHFILCKVNLFTGKVTVHNRDRLLSILTYLIRRNRQALLEIQLPDGLGQKLQTKLKLDPSAKPVLDSFTTKLLIEHIEISLHNIMNSQIREILLDHIYISKEPLALILLVIEKVVMLKSHMTVTLSDKHERQALQFFIEFLSCWLGSLLASVALSENRRILPNALQLFPNEKKLDVASRLKLATVLHCNGDLSEVDMILQSVEPNLSRKIIMVICRCHESNSLLSDELCHVVYALKGRKARAKLFAHCVRFSPQEMYCVPSALRYELHRSEGGPIQDKWMDLAIVDCLPLLYFLQYLTFRQLGRQNLQSRSLQNLDRCVREDRGFKHLGTAWNLLGWCNELELKPEAAMACYRTSLEKRPRNYAAKWHIAILCYRLINQK